MKFLLILIAIICLMILSTENALAYSNWARSLGGHEDPNYSKYFFDVISSSCENFITGSILGFIQEFIFAVIQLIVHFFIFIGECIFATILHPFDFIFHPIYNFKAFVYALYKLLLDGLNVLAPILGLFASWSDHYKDMCSSIPDTPWYLDLWDNISDLFDDIINAFKNLFTW